MYNFNSGQPCVGIKKNKNAVKITFRPIISTLTYVTTIGPHCTH